jgi:hypothetical protein
MEKTWVPPLQLHERGGCCRLTLVGITHGEGRTLQEAGDDLIARLLGIAAVARSSGFGFSTDIPPPDHRLLAFIWDLGERAAAGEDIRGCVFGSVAPPDTSA